MSDHTSPIGALFDALADDYDQSGVSFFEPIAQRLVDVLDPHPGERCLDIGCGRGAVTFPLAGRVAPGGHVTAVDLAPAMVRHVREQADRDRTPGVTTVVMDAADPDLEPGSFDVVASSLVLFFLPDPGRVLEGWVRLLAPGGRIGVTTFGDYDETFEAIDALFTPYLPPRLLDARTSGTTGPFASDEGMEDLMGSAGAAEVRTVRWPLTVSFEDVAAWRRWSMSTGQRAMWGQVPEDERPDLVATATELLESARAGGSGLIELRQDVRHTLGRRPS